MAYTLKRWPQHTIRQIDTVLASMRTSTAPDIQVLLGEILVIRTAQILEESLPEIFGRLACGTKYMDGSQPDLNMPASDVEDALRLMRTHNRNGRRRQLKWLDPSDIKGNVEHIFNASDSSFRVIDRFSSELNELRITRNEAAHHIAPTRAAFRRVLQQYYGAQISTVPVGRFVISTRRTAMAPLTRYTAAARALVRELCKA